MDSRELKESIQWAREPQGDVGGCGENPVLPYGDKEVSGGA
jgi:hypothetical protein